MLLLNEPSAVMYANVTYLSLVIGGCQDGPRVEPGNGRLRHRAVHHGALRRKHLLPALPLLQVLCAHLEHLCTDAQWHIKEVLT